MPSPRSKNLKPVGRKRKRVDRAGPRKKHGRPTEYIPGVHDELAFTVALGFGKTQDLADRLGIHISQVYRWMEKYPKFCEKWSEGKNALHSSSYMSLHKRIMGFTAIEEQETLNPDGRKIIKRIKKEIIPDTAAIAIAFDRLDKHLKPNDEASTEFLDAMKALNPEVLSAIQQLPSSVLEAILNSKQENKSEEGELFED